MNVYLVSRALLADLGTVVETRIQEFVNPALALPLMDLTLDLEMVETIVRGTALFQDTMRWMEGAFLVQAAPQDNIVVVAMGTPMGTPEAFAWPAISCLRKRSS